MKIYTKKGDQGRTSIIGETNLSKDDARIEAYGTIDELNSFIGLLRSFDPTIFKKQKDELIVIQKALFCIGASLASKDNNTVSITQEDITSLETFIDNMDANLPTLKSFILPGGDVWTAYAQICRSICRRAERRIISMHEKANIDPYIIPFINRLSDYFFVLARYISKLNNTEEIKWTQ